jgi:hypothetical protein
MGCYQAIGIGGMGKLFGEQALHAFFELSVQGVLSNDSRAQQWGIYHTQKSFQNAKLIG